MDKNIDKLEKILGTCFKDKELILTAITHRSYLNEHPDSIAKNNERLEFLGDAVLELVVSEYLYCNFEKQEGEMTNLRASLVNTNKLSEVASNLNIEEFLFLSKGERKDIGRARKSLLANAVEAIIGAIYIDKGLEFSRIFIEKNILSSLPEILEKKVIKDPKSLFQEIVQEKFNITPDYKVLKESGPDHKREFTMGIFLKNKMIDKGSGFSKQEAEEEAARKALENLDKS